MDAHVKAVVEECTLASDEDRMSFPEVVGKLIEAGVERYHYDIARAEKTYYMPDGDFYVTPCLALAQQPARDFSAEEVEAAVRAIQRDEIKYLPFCERIVAAGCAGYLVSTAGRRAVYYGRTGETYVEPFPQAK
jgi:uncharacterized protein YbcV (DUF1398 family)